jgi:hypothetical protein
MYRDYEVELIINGDFFNFLQCDYKGHFLSVITEAVTLDILKDVIKGHENVFKAMAEFAAKPGNSITYIVGNHDQGMLWPACRAYLNQVVGAPVRFKNIVYFFDGVHIEHGHMHEAANRMDPKKFFLKKNLVEPILNLPFGSHFQKEVGTKRQIQNRLHQVLFQKELFGVHAVGRFMHMTMLNMNTIKEINDVLKADRRTNNLIQVSTACRP